MPDQKITKKSRPEISARFEATLVNVRLECLNSVIYRDDRHLRTVYICKQSKDIQGVH